MLNPQINVVASLQQRLVSTLCILLVFWILVPSLFSPTTPGEQGIATVHGPRLRREGKNFVFDAFSTRDRGPPFALPPLFAQTHKKEVPRIDKGDVSFATARALLRYSNLNEEIHRLEIEADDWFHVGYLEGFLLADKLFSSVSLQRERLRRAQKAENISKLVKLWINTTETSQSERRGVHRYLNGVLQGANLALPHSQKLLLEDMYLLNAADEVDALLSTDGTPFRRARGAVSILNVTVSNKRVFSKGQIIAEFQSAHFSDFKASQFVSKIFHLGKSRKDFVALAGCLPSLASIIASDRKLVTVAHAWLRPDGNESPALEGIPYFMRESSDKALLPFLQTRVDIQDQSSMSILCQASLCKNISVSSLNESFSSLSSPLEGLLSSNIDSTSLKDRIALAYNVTREALENTFKDQNLIHMKLTLTHSL